FASIRRIVQTRPNEIYKIKPGLYGLVSHRALNEANGILAETPHNKNSKKLKESNHYYYQGLLLTIGNLRRFQTFAPNQDKNRQFLNITLGELRTLEKVPPFSYDYFINKISTVDVVWFNKRTMPDSLFEVESTTDIIKSLSKFCDLQDFNVRMLIVADKVRKPEFESKIAGKSFESIKNRVQFLDYNSLVKQYEHEIERAQFETIV
ncbi:MAG TPA: hypothetical protein VNK07_00080, partial [Candidatus Binatia bacterium]|nr:hypothetical protein [Candidatus Binatia bacterium]